MLCNHIIILYGKNEILKHTIIEAISKQLHSTPCYYSTYLFYTDVVVLDCNKYEDKEIKEKMGFLITNSQINWLFLLSDTTTPFTRDIQCLTGVKSLWVINKESVEQQLQKIDEELYKAVKVWFKKIDKTKDKGQISRLRNFEEKEISELNEDMSKLREEHTKKLREYNEKHKDEYKPTKVNVCNNKFIMKGPIEESHMAAEILTLTPEEAASKLTLQEYLAYIKLKYKYSKYVETQVQDEDEETIDTMSASGSDRQSTPKIGSEEI